ncbi:MAG: PIN domain-containing protein [Thermoleophilia bacterium]
MKTASWVLDASALLAYLKREEGFRKVKAVLSAAAEGGAEVLINEINLGEVYSVIAKQRSLSAADSIVSEWLPLIPVTPISNSMADIIAVAGLTARLGLHYADSFAAITAGQRNGVLLTTDRDFEKVAGEIRIHWLRQPSPGDKALPAH